MRQTRYKVSVFRYQQTHPMPLDEFLSNDKESLINFCHKNKSLMNRQDCYLQFNDKETGEVINF